MSVGNIAQTFIKALEKADFPQMKALMAEDVVNYVTNWEGTSDQVIGREAYLERVRAMDIPSAKLSLSIPQALPLAPDKVLLMVEVKAERSGKTLHNFSAILFQMKEGKITHSWMVEALPQKSDEFWKSSGRVECSHPRGKKRSTPR